MPLGPGPLPLMSSPAPLVSLAAFARPLRPNGFEPLAADEVASGKQAWPPASRANRPRCVGAGRSPMARPSMALKPTLLTGYERREMPTTIPALVGTQYGALN